MLSAIINFSLRYRVIVLLITLLIMLLGIYQSFRSSLDVFPDFVPPQVTIQTEAPGLTPEQVEKLVTYPIEAAVSGMPGLDTVRSESIQGLSVVTVSFQEQSNILEDRQLLTERMTEVASRLPTQAKSPTLSPLVSSTMDLLKIGLTSDALTPRQLRTFADWKLKPHLLAIPGVADVNVVGGAVKQLEIKVNAQKLVERKLTMSDVTKAASEATGIRGAGYMETKNQRLLISVEGKLSDPEVIGATVIKGSGGDIIRLRDVAVVDETSSPKFGDALIMGRPGVLLALTSQYETNTLDVTKRVELALKDFTETLEKEKIVLHSGLHRPANFIELALEHIRSSLAIGAVLVLIVLLVFLHSFRIALISFVSIPISLLCSIIFFRAFGLSLNTMTLGGFAVAIGVVVDDAIIDVENIVKRLRENAALESPRSILKVILDASVEVRGAIVYATLIVIAAFIPVFLLGGIQGRFFMPLGLAFVVATISSLVVAITVTPALCSLLISKTRVGSEPFYLRWIKSFHIKILAIVGKLPKTISLVALIFLLSIASLLSSFTTSFLPDFREGHFVAQISMVPGTSLQEMTRIGSLLSEELLADSRIQSVEMQAGRSEQGVDTWGPERAELHIELKPNSNLDESIVQNDIREIISQYPGIQSEVLTFLGDRIGETISGETAQIVLSLYGDDLNLLEKNAGQIVTEISQIKGTTDVYAKSSELAPRLVIELKSKMLENYGLRAVEVLDTIQMMYQGMEVAQLYENSQIIPLVVSASSHEGTIAQIAELPIFVSSGLSVQLGDLATIYTATGRASIEHDGGRRRQIITCNTVGRSVADVESDIRDAIHARVKLDNDTQSVFSGTAESESEAHRNLLFSSSLAIVIIVALLWMAFRTINQVTLVIINLPFAIAGGILALYVAKLPISLGSLVGMVTLFGISSRNAIMMLTHFEYLVQKENLPWDLKTAIRGASERLIPVLMTATVTALALLPIALNPQAAGQEIEGPMAIVILGGLITSTALTLFLLPIFALKFGRFQPIVTHSPPSN